MATKRAKDRRRDKGRGKSPGERLRSFRGLFDPGDEVLILINPDPDSIASALAVKRLLWKRVHRTSIAYIGEIQRLDNKAMVDLLKIRLVKLREIAAEEHTRTVLVDSQPHHYEEFSNFRYDAIIDHHPMVKRLRARFVDVRPDYGATATLLIEYLRAARIKPSMRLATALLYAIKTDTANFERDATGDDVKAFRYIFQYANLNLVRKIERSELSIGDLDYYQKALEERVMTKKGIYAHLGKVESPDICVQVADFFMQVYGIGWSFVSGVYNDRLVVIIRNDGYRKNAGRQAIDAFGKLGSAGGHRGAARAEIPLGALRQEGIQARDSSLRRFVRRRLPL